MKRAIFNITAAASLVLCLTVSALWVRTIWRPSSVLLPPVTVGTRGYLLFSAEGRISFMACWENPATHDQRIEEMRKFAGFWFIRRDGIVDEQSSLVIGAPYWFLTLATAILPLWRLRREHQARQRHRAETNRCVQCGYDLRATPNRCPECGTSVVNVIGASSSSAT